VEIETKIVENDIIVLSQSCDIDIHHPKLTTILVSKIIPLEDFLKEKTKKSREKEIKSLKRRERPNLLLLTLGLDNSSKWILVDFHECYGVPYEYLKNKTHPRYRLKSPYKEYLAQSFAFYMMRVALPMDINEKVIIELLEKGK
jgi:hypothetical protein